jgi:hypothetical protein
MDIAWAEPERRALQVRHLTREVIAGDVEIEDPHDFLPAYLLPLMCRGRRPMIMQRIILNIGTLCKLFPRAPTSTAANGITRNFGVVVWRRAGPS